jgi:hypothetical protein
MNETNDVKTQPPPTPPPPVAPPPVTAARPAAARPEKLPGLAALLSIIPGLGQLYADAFDRAVMIFATLVLLILAAVNQVLPVVLTVFACLFVWFYGMFDAYRQAQLANVGGIEPEPVRRRRGESRLMFGVFLFVVGGLLLVENLNLFDLDWLMDWWPAAVVAIGIYLIYAAIKERGQHKDDDTTTGGVDPGD